MSELVWSVYFGSVRFFKHLIIGTLLLIVLAAFGLLFLLWQALFPSVEAVEADKPVLLPPPAAATAAVGNYEKITLHTSDEEAPPLVPSVEDPPAADAAVGVLPGSEKPAEKPYRLLYPDLYRDPPIDPTAEENTVYLTFDDGPSQQTPRILKILADNDVKATFFVISHPDKSSLGMMRQIVREGHTIGIHSYTHDYEKIYASVEAFLEDFHQIDSLIFEATGIKPDIFRFPGGSINSYNGKIYKDIMEEMSRRGFTYYDWNVSALDTLSSATAGSIRRDIMEEVPRHARSIVLMHDSGAKSQTVNALDGVIKELKQHGYTLDKLTNRIKPVVFKY